MMFGLDAIPGRESGIGHIRNDIGVGSSISDQQLARSNTRGSGSNGLPHRLLQKPVAWSGLRRRLGQKSFPRDFSGQLICSLVPKQELGNESDSFREFSEGG